MDEDDTIASTESTNQHPANSVVTNHVAEESTAATPMETSDSNKEEALTNGLDIKEKCQYVRNCGDNMEEVINTTRAIVNSVKTSPLPPPVIEAAHYMTSFLLQKQQPIKGISILEDLLAVRGADTVLSSLHADYVLLCLAAKMLSLPLRILDEDITAVADDEDGLLDVEHVLQYFYYGGVIYSALRKYHRALHFFEMCLSVPSQVPSTPISAIQVEAYQKFVLVWILTSNGSIPRLPINLNIPYVARPYLNLAQTAREDDSEKFASSLAQLTPLLEKHNNLGLAKQALECLRRKDITKLENTYISIKLETLAKYLTLPVLDIERRIFDMIITGEISAKICKKEGIVWFNKGSDVLDDDEAINSLTDCLQSCIATYGKLKNLNDEISLSRQFIGKVCESEERSKKEAAVASSSFPVKGKKVHETM